MLKQFRLIQAGVTDFHAAWTLQRELAESVRRGAESVLMLLQHAPVITLGKNADRANLLTAGDIPVVQIDRGGDVTYHGPGQLMAYPILSLRERRIGIREHVLRIERSIVATLKDFGIDAKLRDDCVGVWSAKGKIASLGIRVERGVTMHGMALNVTTDLAPFERINPCGVKSCAMSSVSIEAGQRIDVESVAEKFLPHFAREFRFEAWADRPVSFVCGPP